jgi:putative toxin-antitoxin system antitoxin component (TIGR02293 family)
MRSRRADVIRAVRKGLPAATLEAMVQKLAIDRTVLLNVLGISSRTLQRKFRAHDKLSPMASDRLSRVERIYGLAIDVLGSPDKGAAWLKRSSRALNNQRPIELLDTDAGAQDVERELRQIEHGFVY